MAVQTEVVFPRSLRDMYPAAAQQVYIETYKQSWETSVAGTRDNLSRESVAARDAWEAVGRVYAQDPVTHKFHGTGDPVAAEPTRIDKRSFVGKLKNMFKSN